MIEMEEGDTGREQDLSDLETFGSSRRADRERDDVSKKAVIQRRGLFGKALDEAQGKKRRSEDEHEGLFILLIILWLFERKKQQLEEFCSC